VKPYIEDLGDQFKETEGKPSHKDSKHQRMKWLPEEKLFFQVIKHKLCVHLSVIDTLRYGPTNTKRYKPTNNQLCLSCNETKVPKKEE